MLEHLLYPKCVAVVGASRDPSKVGHVVLRNIIEGGYKGTIIVGHPKADEILGIKCYKSLTEYEGKIDLSIIVVPTLSVKEAVQDSLKAGVNAVCVITAGFKEIGPEGAKLQKEIANLCKAAGVRMLGPNVVGLINPHHNFNASFATTIPPSGGIAVISQSGAICTVMLDWAMYENIGLASLISIGNKGDLDEIDFIKALSLEDIQQGDNFIRAATEAAHFKPIIIYKAGTSKAGAKAASSHTGSLAGADIAYGAAFKRAGIIRAETFAQLEDYSVAFAMQPVPQGDNVAIITNAGGPGIMAADALEECGFKIGPLRKDIADALKAKLAPAASVQNPIDVLGDASPETYVEAVNAAQDDPNIDAIVCLTAPQAMTAPSRLAQGIVDCARREKPIITVFMGGTAMVDAHKILMKNNIPEFKTPNRASNALRAMRDYALWLKRPPRIVTRFPVNRRRVERIISRHIKTGHLRIGEVEGKEILKAYDFNIPEGYLALSADEAIEVAERLGYPVAMKIVSKDIIHKSDLGGVRLNLATKQMVEDSFDLMMLRIKRRMPEAVLDGVYVEKMGGRGREVILGMSRDPQFGPMLMFGLGGIFVEVMKDVTFYLAPITQDEAMQMLKSTKSYALLTGARGQAAVDLESIATALQRISQLVTDFEEIDELDINPFIVGEPGVEPYVADARMSVSEKGKKYE
jgi:acetyl coenzyme A synthetase (ADP forming)-like protein